MRFKEIQGLVDTHIKRLKRDNAISIIQLGSSLRKDEFMGNSDLDLLVIYKNPIKKGLKFESHNEIEVNLIRRGKKQYLESLIEGNPVDLIALNFGKVLWDKGFFKKLETGNYKPTKRTTEFWIHTASFNISDTFHNYSLPTCMCCYFKALHHAARDFSRAIILKEREKLVESDKDVIRELNKAHPDLVGKYKLILSGRRRFEDFRDNLIKANKIRANQRGKFLLACEDFAILAYKIVLNLRLPKINSIISKLETEYRLNHFSGYFLYPEKKKIQISFRLKNGELKILYFDLEKITDED